MGKRESYEAKTAQLIQPVVEANGVELFDVDYVKEGSDWYLRVYIDKEGGIAVDDWTGRITLMTSIFLR